MSVRGKRLALTTAALALAVLGVAAWLSWPHLRFWWLFEPLGKNAQGLPEYRHRRTGIVMVRVPGGKFWMGAQRVDPNGRNYDPEAEGIEDPVHEVSLSPFLIAKYEVTQAEWQSVMGNNPSHFKGSDLPVEMVSWDDCQEFCQKAGLQLPTEEMWEYACRAQTTNPLAGTGKSSNMGWYSENSGNTTHPVGQKAPNGFGLHDLHGNVWELCQTKYETNEGHDPGGDDDSGSGGNWALRGGAFNLPSGFVRCPCDDRKGPFYVFVAVGFRVSASPFPSGL